MRRTKHKVINQSIKWLSGANGSQRTQRDANHVLFASIRALRLQRFREFDSLSWHDTFRGTLRRCCACLITTNTHTHTITAHIQLLDIIYIHRLGVKSTGFRCGCCVSEHSAHLMRVAISNQSRHISEFTFVRPSVAVCVMKFEFHRRRLNDSA